MHPVKVWIGLVAVCLVAGCRTATVQSEPTAPSGVIPATAEYVPAQTLIQVRLQQTIDTETSRVGDRFSATVTSDVVAANGEVVIPAGSLVTGRVTQVDRSESVGDQASIRLAFDRILVRGDAHPFAAEIVKADVQQDRKGRDVATGAGVGALAGAALGAIIGGDVSDALVGGALGAGGGTLIALGAGDVEARLPAGTPMTLRTTSNLDLQAQPVAWPY